MNKPKGIGRFVKGDLAWMEKHYDQRFLDIEERVRLAKENVDSLMEGFPGTYMRIGAVEPEMTTIKAELKAMDKVFNQMEGKASQKSLVFTLVIALVSLLIAGVVGIAGLLRHFQY